MLYHWHAAVDKGESVRTVLVFVDFAKAFDHVDHDVLITKLVTLGRHRALGLHIFARATATREDRRRPVRLAAAVCWNDPLVVSLTSIIPIDALRP